MKKFVTFFIFFFLSSFIFAQRFIVQLNNKANIDSISIHLFSESEKYTVSQINEQLNLYSIVTTLNQNQSERFLQYLKNLPSIQYAQIDHVVSSRAMPNDSLFSSQWDMTKINLQKVWEKTKGGLTTDGDTIVVGVIEPEGFDYRHQDLLPNIWRNHAETPNNNIDDDKNGYKDDYYGLNMKSRNDKHIPHFHGTSVAGIIGAKGDNRKGVTGVNWNVKIMLLSECSFESQIIEAYSYMLNQRKLYNETKGKKGAFVVVSNASWGFPYRKASDMPLLCALYDELGKVGIVSVAATDNTKRDVDKTYDIPSNCTSDYLLIVTNTDKQDKLFSSAAFGNSSVDLSAPGQGSFTIGSSNSFGTFGGCSAATPHVAGAIALLCAAPTPKLIADYKAKPSETALFLKNVILNGTVQIPDLKGVTTNGGRLDVFQSYQLLLEKYNPIDKVSITKFYPNPTKDYLNIEFDTNSFQALEINIFNLLGQKVATDFFNPLNLKQDNHTINVSSLSKGIYFLSLIKKGEKEGALVKFIKL